MAGKIDVTLVRKAVRSGAPSMVRRLIEKLEPRELAPMLPELSPSELKTVFIELLEERRVVVTLLELPEELFAEVVRNVDAALLARALRRFELDDAARLLRRIADEVREGILECCDGDYAQQMRRLLRYSPDSAGGRMIPRFVAVPVGATVGEGIAAIRRAPPEVPIFYLYVTDGVGKLVGVVSLGQLVKAQDDAALADLMTADVVSVAPDADQEDVARLVVRTNVLALPVVEDGLLLGLLTIDDVVEVIEEEATEDMYAMAGLQEGDRVFSPPQRSLLKRLPWNALNLGTALIAASVVSAFEDTIQQLVALAVFMPVIAGIGGNSGTQTLTVIIRGIALGELEFSSALRALFKEVLVGLCIGLSLGGLTAVVAWLWKGNAMLGVVVALAMVANLLIASLVGTAVPLLLRRFNKDPALGSSILVTMCTDTFGFLAFLGLATIFLKYLI